MIVLDTTVLVYAKGAEHPLREPCRALLEAVDRGRVQATTTADAIREFVHVRARRYERTDAADLGRAYADLLAPLLPLGESDLREGLRLFERHPSLGASDAVLAAAAIATGATALISADRAFADVPALRHVDPTSPRIADLIG